MALFECFKHKALQKFSHEDYIGWNLQKFSPADISRLQFTEFCVLRTDTRDLLTT